MPRPVLSVVRGSEACDRDSRTRDTSRSATALIDRLLKFTVVRGRAPEKPDQDLVPLATALVKCKAMWRRMVASDECTIPEYGILLLAYVRQAENSGLPLRSLAGLREIGPDTVLLRWAAKLLGDGMLELAQAESRPAETCVRLSSDGLRRVETWLHSAKADIESAL